MVLKYLYVNPNILLTQYMYNTYPFNIQMCVVSKH